MGSETISDNSGFTLESYRATVDLRERFVRDCQIDKEAFLLRGSDFASQLRSLCISLDKKCWETDGKTFNQWQERSITSWIELCSQDKLSYNEVVLFIQITGVYMLSRCIDQKWKSTAKLIVIEGSAGVGKSALSEKIAENIRCQLAPEVPDENPWFAASVGEKKELKKLSALAAQVQFIVNAYESLLVHFISSENGSQSKITIVDRLFGHKAFQKMHINAGNISWEDAVVFDLIDSIFKSGLPENIYVIMLIASDDILLERVKTRRRPEEATYTKEFLKEIQDITLDIILSIMRQLHDVHFVDTSKLNVQEVYDKCIKEIRNNWKIF